MAIPLRGGIGGGKNDDETHTEKHERKWNSFKKTFDVKQCCAQRKQAWFAAFVYDLVERFGLLLFSAQFVSRVEEVECSLIVRFLSGKPKCISSSCKPRQPLFAAGPRFLCFDVAWIRGLGH